MSDASPRLSQLAGIKSRGETADSFWLMNAVLLLLGATILGIAFYFLDPQDERITHNPWTYVVATPIVLCLLSMLLSTLVSRLVEKSMQVAFLVSVLIHLILLVYAVNIVIFSRMWPDVLESLEAQRQQMRQTNLHAREYHRVATSAQTGSRPDYLQPVPTQHQPTEVEEVPSRELALSRARQDNLLSPSPQIELTNDPRLIEREQAASSLPAFNEQAASLSRSQLRQQQPEGSSQAAVVPEASYDTPSPALQAAGGALQRAAAGREADLDSISAPEAQAPLPTPDIARAASPDREPAPAASTPLAAARQRLDVTQPRSQSSIIAPDNPQAPSSVSPLTADAAASPSRRANASVIPQPLAATIPEPARSPAAAPRVQRNESTTTNRVPNIQQSLAKDSAGGETGPAAPTSTPIYGVPELGSPQSPPASELQAAAVRLPDRGSGVRRAMPDASAIGVPRSLSWSGRMSSAAGLAGRSPAELAADVAEGQAAAADVAGLRGSQGPIERSPLSAPPSSSTPEAATPSLANTSSADAAQTPEPPASSAKTNGSRRSSSGANIPATASASSESSTGEPQELAALSGSLARTEPKESDSLSDIAAGSQLSRASHAAPAPAGESIAIPEIALKDLAGEPQNPLRSGQSIAGPSRRPANAALATPLEIDGPRGPGGIAPTPLQSGPVMARRDARPRDFAPLDFDSQRFARQDVGGPLAAGQKVPIPRPAFQQRLDRVKDRQGRDETIAEPQTELAIERGLAFLAKYQRSDGSWKLQEFDAEVLMRSDTAATGLSLLAFQGAGYTHQQFKYADNVDRALQFLVAHQLDNGDLYIRQDPASDQNAWLYSHAIAALALCEAYGMTQDEQLKPYAQKAVDFMVASQDPRRGGWRYRPGVGADTSVTGWFMMAFKSAQLAGLTVPDETLRRIESYLEESQQSEAEAYLYRYNPFASDTPQQRHGLEPTAVMTSVGLLMRLYSGWQRERPEMIAGADYLLENLPAHGSRSESLRDTYYWYYATQVLFHMRGERWKQWHDRLYPLLIQHQVTEGENSGSWDPMTPTPDLWARYGGRLYVTTMNLLSLEVSYRHLPLYDATAR